MLAEDRKSSRSSKIEHFQKKMLWLRIRQKSSKCELFAKKNSSPTSQKSWKSSFLELFPQKFQLRNRKKVQKALFYEFWFTERGVVLTPLSMNPNPPLHARGKFSPENRPYFRRPTRGPFGVFLGRFLTKKPKKRGGFPSF